MFEHLAKEGSIFRCQRRLLRHIRCRDGARGGVRVGDGQGREDRCGDKPLFREIFSDYRKNLLAPISGEVLAIG